MWDLALHIKTPPDIGNELHLFTPYEDRIQLTYLRWKQETQLVRLNRKDADAPLPHHQCKPSEPGKTSRL